jgi:DNA-binding PadR family transcriptional regulator
MDDYENRMYEYIQNGAIEVSGIDDSGEFIFQITEKAKEVAPDLWEAHEEHLNKTFLELFDRGLVNISYNEDLEATFELTEEGKKVAKEYGLIENEE